MDAHDIARAVVTELKGILEHDFANRPRTLQTTLGPSEVGTACDRCLIHMLAGHPEQQVGVPWLPELGTAVHDYFDMALTRHMLAQLDAGVKDFGAEWITEGKVNVGDINGVPVTGSSDVFHKPTGTVVDYKIAGTTTLRKVRRDGSGTSLTYQRQGHLYGRGWARAGYRVRAVAIWFVPRNGLTLADGRLWTAPYDEQVAIDALARATRFVQFISAVGAEKVLAAAAPHTHEEFSCSRYPTPGDTPKPPSDLAGLIPA